MDVLVKQAMNPRPVTVWIAEDATVSRLYEEVSKETGLEAGSFELSVQGRVLQGGAGEEVRDTELVAGCEVLLTQSPKHAARLQLRMMGLKGTPREFLVACESGPSDTVRLFLKAGYNPDLVPHCGFGIGYPLHLAASADSHKVVEILISGGANINRKDDDGWTPLHFACRIRGTKSLAHLLRARADVMSLTNYCETPLHVALCPYAVEALVSAGADVNAQDREGATALYRAVQHHRLTVPALLEAGADPLITTLDGKTSIDCARANNCAVLQLLLTSASSSSSSSAIFSVGDRVRFRDSFDDSWKLGTVESILDGGQPKVQSDGQTSSSTWKLVEKVDGREDTFQVGEQDTSKVGTCVSLRP